MIRLQCLALCNERGEWVEQCEHAGVMVAPGLAECRGLCGPEGGDGGNLLVMVAMMEVCVETAEAVCEWGQGGCCGQGMRVAESGAGDGCDVCAGEGGGAGGVACVGALRVGQRGRVTAGVGQDGDGNGDRAATVEALGGRANRCIDALLIQPRAVRAARVLGVLRQARAPDLHLLVSNSTAGKGSRHLALATVATRNRRTLSRLLTLTKPQPAALEYRGGCVGRRGGRGRGRLQHLSSTVPIAVAHVVPLSHL